MHKFRFIIKFCGGQFFYCMYQPGIQQSLQVAKIGRKAHLALPATVVACLKFQASHFLVSPLVMKNVCNGFLDNMVVE